MGLHNMLVPASATSHKQRSRHKVETGYRSLEPPHCSSWVMTTSGKFCSARRCQGLKSYWLGSGIQGKARTACRG